MSTLIVDARAAIPERTRVNFSWLLKLRWAELAGQVVTIVGVAWGLSIAVPVFALLLIASIGVVSNVLAEIWFRRVSIVQEWSLALVMALDVVLLTLLLYFTGGPINPFSFLYLVQIALATVVLHAQWTWMLVAFSLGSFGLLVLYHQPLPLPDLATHQLGMWVALGISSAFIVYFLVRITTALAVREDELAEARALTSRHEHLASLATMAAGAAHELATPLGTIALVAKELERRLASLQSLGGERAEAVPDSALEDARLIRQEAGRCRGILDQMAGGAGASAGEGLDAGAVGDIIREAMVAIRDEPAVRLAMSKEVAETSVFWPSRAVCQTLRSLVTNAQDASLSTEPVAVSVVVRERGDAGSSETNGYTDVVIEIADRGHGMTPQVLARVGEPFFTTKDPGRGMGLGLYLSRAVLEGVGGRLDIESQEGAGTRVRATLPMDARRGGPVRGSQSA